MQQPQSPARRNVLRLTIAATLADDAIKAGATLQQGASVWGIYPGWQVCLSGERPQVIEASQLVLATGARNRALPVPGAQAAKPPVEPGEQPAKPGEAQPAPAGQPAKPGEPQPAPGAPAPLPPRRRPHRTSST